MSRFFIAVALALGLWATADAATAPARAEILISVDKATQRMAVVVNGRLRHNWAVSTGRAGGPPSGSFRPQRMYRSYFSRTYDNAPMPHSIFFHHGFAIHGTNEVSRLGRRASRGCVRLHPGNAAALFALVRRHGMRNTRVVISDSRRAARR